MPAEEPSIPDFADDAVGRLENARRLEIVQAALVILSRPEREVVALCWWSELSYPDAAKALGIPVGTVRSRLSRARKKLRRELLGIERQVDGDRGIAVRIAWEEMP